jgi:hypothetical protein
LLVSKSEEPSTIPGSQEVGGYDATAQLYKLPWAAFILALYLQNG